MSKVSPTTRRSRLLLKWRRVPLFVAPPAVWAALVIVMLWLTPFVASATDVTFTCNSDIADCSLSSSDPIFDVDNLVPGESVIKSIEVKNESSEDACDFYLRLGDRSVQPIEFDDRLFTALRDNDDSDKYGATDGDKAKNDKKLHDLFGGVEVDKIDTILASTTKEYDWLVTFDENAGNEFMGAEVSFTAEMTGECGEEEPPQVGGIMDDGEGGPGVTGGLLTRFPTAGAESAAKWLAGEKDWSRMIAAVLAMTLTACLMIRVAKLSGKSKVK